MKFRTDSAEWIGEVKSYLTDSSKKIGEIKKVLKAVDFEKLSYADKVRLSKLFDPTAEISDELFKRQLDLYFSLLESKSSPISIPVFSEYIEWVYSQDTSKIPDKIFEMMSLRLAKSKAETLPESVTSFMTRLTKEFEREIDDLSNTRLMTLVSVLKEMGLDYKSLPTECQEFIKKMFIACSVKTEIADKNKKEIRGLFRDDPREYYSLFNKAFARLSPYDIWIDEPAKKLTVKNMINYANFQESVIRSSGNRLSFMRFQECASSLKLPRFPEYDPMSSYFRDFYLREPREYKSYAKKMSEIFAEMVKFEVLEVAKQAKGRTLTDETMSKFATTHRMARKIARLGSSATPESLGMSYADALIDFVHLDELTGQSKRDIVNYSDLTQALAEPRQMTLEEAVSRADKSSKSSSELSREEVKLQRELSQLYDEYHELCEKGLKDLSLEERILTLEDKLKAYSESEPGETD